MPPRCWSRSCRSKLFCSCLEMASKGPVMALYWVTISGGTSVIRFTRMATPLWDVPIGNALGFLVQLPQAVLLQLLAHGFLRHGVQEPFHFCLHGFGKLRNVVSR